MAMAGVRFIGTALRSLLAVALCSQLAVAAGNNTEQPKSPAVYSEEGLLDAAFDSCISVAGRSARACNCEKRILSDETTIEKKEDRLTLEDKEMAFFYYVDRARFRKEVQAKRESDASWVANFSRKMTHLQALMIGACGR